MTDNYEDIINLPHHVSKKHPQMPMHARAAQFAAFVALTGHQAAIKEAMQHQSENAITWQISKDTHCK